MRNEDLTLSFLLLKSAELRPNRPVTVRFNADVSVGMRWKFVPCQREVFAPKATTDNDDFLFTGVRSNVFQANVFLSSSMPLTLPTIL